MLSAPLPHALPRTIRTRIHPLALLSSQVPAPSTTLAIGVALVTSTVPSLLPRPAWTQGLLAGVLVLAAVGLVAVVRRATGPRATGADAGGGRAGVLVLAATALVVLVAGTLSWLGLSEQAVTLGLPEPGLAHALTAGAWTLLVVGVGLTLARGVTAALRALRTSSTARVATVLVLGASVTTASASAPGVLDGLLDGLRKGHPSHILLQESPVGATRVLALADEADGPEAVARLAVDRLVTAGGLARRAVVVVVPTGSGWVNDVAVREVEAQLGGDVAVVSAQAGDLPSWYYFLLDQDPARRAASTLVHGVVEVVGEVPAADRPDVYVLGESLGATVGQAAVAELPDPAGQVCAAVWSGTPGTTTSGHPRERTLLNADDPITHLTTRTAYQRPEDWPGTWLPGLSYATTWLDTSVSLSTPSGHGHRYGAEQDWTLPTC